MLMLLSVVRAADEDSWNSFYTEVDTFGNNYSGQKCAMVTLEWLKLGSKNHDDADKKWTKFTIVFP